MSSEEATRNVPSGDQSIEVILRLCVVLIVLVEMLSELLELFLQALISRMCNVLDTAAAKMLFPLGWNRRGFEENPDFDVDYLKKSNKRSIWLGLVYFLNIHVNLTIRIVFSH